MFPVCSWYDVAYLIYKTSGCISSDSEYRCGEYANSLEKYFKYDVMWRKYFPCTKYIYEIPFFMLCNYNKDTRIFFVIAAAYVTPLFQHVKLPFVHHIDKIKHVVLILNSLCQLPVFVALFVYHPYSPIVWLIEHEIYDQSCKYSSETCACTIIECVIVRYVPPATSTWPLIYWWSVSDNASCNPQKERPYWNYLKVNFVRASLWILSLSHQQNSSNFQILREEYLAFPWLPQYWYIPFHKVLEYWNNHPRLKGNY